MAQVWVGASGISHGASTQWGGANVFVSVDNVTFSQIAVLTAPLRQGFLTASLAAASGWDATDTLAVDLAESAGTLTGTSQAAAQQGATLSLVDNELLAYETATLTGGNAYNLTGLARGLAGSVAGRPCDRRALRAARWRGRQVRSAGEPHRPDALFQVPELQRLRRRPAGPVDVRGLQLHAGRDGIGRLGRLVIGRERRRLDPIAAQLV